MSAETDKAALREGLVVSLARNLARAADKPGERTDADLAAQEDQSR